MALHLEISKTPNKFSISSQQRPAEHLNQLFQEVLQLDYLFLAFPENG
jgi:hypothetical protein